MATFLKANLSSTIASLIDYIITIFLVSVYKVDVVIASATGTICGGIVNYIVGRHWVFDAKHDKIHHQAFRYGLVWVGNLILNTSGVYLMVNILQINYVISKAFVSLVVGFCYNYTLQKRFVFKKNNK